MVTERVAPVAGDPRTAFAIGPEAMLANERTDAGRFRFDRVQRIGACELDIKLCAGMAIEECHRALCRGVPLTLRRRGKASDPPQFGLDQFCDLSRRSLRFRV